MPVALSLTEYLQDTHTELPPLLEIHAATEQIIALHRRAGGATFNLRFGNQTGQKLFAVSIFPERTLLVPARELTPEVLLAFIRRNSDLLEDPRCCIGTWFDADDGVTYLDVTFVVSGRQVAVRLGQKYNQVAVFDLARLQVIATSGSGEPVSNLPPERERLPRLRRRRRRKE